MAGTDIASQKDLFFEHFKIQPKTITLSMRDSLEAIWLHKYYEYEDTTINWNLDDEDRIFSDTYTLEYLADQWYGVDLKRYNPETKQYEAIFRGEGDSPTFALLGLFIDAEELLDEQDIESLKAIFSEDLTTYEEQYK